MPQTHHLLIAYAASHTDGCTHALQTLRLPHLERLLAQLGRSAPEPGQDSDPTLPHERALAQALGWTLQAQGLLPVTGWVWLPAEAGVPLLAAGVAGLAALLPAMQAYRTDVADLLSQP